MTEMTGQLVELLIQWHRLPAGTEGIVSGRNVFGWVMVFGSTCITLPFESEGVLYQFIGGS